MCATQCGRSSSPPPKDLQVNRGHRHVEVRPPLKKPPKRGGKKKTSPANLSKQSLTDKLQISAAVIQPLRCSKRLKSVFPNTSW